jgi:hypothetical protein
MDIDNGGYSRRERVTMISLKVKLIAAIAATITTIRKLVQVVQMVMLALTVTLAPAYADDCGPVSTYWNPSGGDDKNSGRSPSTAKRTDGAALAAANGPVYVYTNGKLYFWRCVSAPDPYETVPAPTGGATHERITPVCFASWPVPITGVRRRFS